MTRKDSRVTVHMAASLDGYIARTDGSVDWMDTSDDFPAGETLDPAYVEQFLDSIDCYVMGSRTYETALQFESRGLGWSYGDKPVYVLTTRTLAASRNSVVFRRGDLAALINDELRSRFRNIWVAGGGQVCSDCLRLGLADQVSCSILPVLIGDGIRFFDSLGRDIALHLAEVRAYRNGIVEVRYELPDSRDR